MLEGKDSVRYRISDASTNDYDFSSDGEKVAEDKGLIYLTLSEKSLIYTPLPADSVLMYSDLTEKLKNLYISLEEELQPVCVRDDKGIKPLAVNLSSVDFSRISKRRATLPLQNHSLLS